MDEPNPRKPSTTTQRHWVEELFPPHFTVDLEDLNKQPEQADEGSLEAWRIAQRKKVKDIYQEVKDQMDAEARVPKDKNIQVGEPLEKARHKIKLKGQVKRVEESKGNDGSPLVGREKENKARGDAIWSAGEMAILRGEFKKLKDERRVVTIEMRTLEGELAALRKKHKHQEKVLNRRESELKMSRQENQRLAIQTEALTKEVRLQTSKLVMAEGDYKDVVEQRRSMRKEIIEQRKSLAKATRDARELQITLSESDTRHRLEVLEREEAMKLEYESQIARLYQELTETREDLEKECLEHSRSTKALNHLRVHFAQQVVGRGQRQALDSEPSGTGRNLNVLQLF